MGRLTGLEPPQQRCRRSSGDIEADTVTGDQAVGRYADPTLLQT
jgi:hypothetical protein